MKQSPVPVNSIAVFLQSERHRGLTETCHLDMRQMVKALVARDDSRNIVIKPHPLDDDPATGWFLHEIAARDARVRVMDGNIHDILKCASVAVTINSAVGMEAMLHAVPVVLCGKADFHHAAVTVRAPAALDGAIVKADAEVWPHDAFVYFYFRLNWENAGRNSLVQDLLERVYQSRDQALV